MNQKSSVPLIIAVSTLSFILLVAICGCSSAPRKSAASSSDDMSKAVAKILARNAAGAVLFKDTEAANAVTASISETERLKFALILNKNLSPFSQYFTAPLDHENQHLVDAIQKRVRDGATEFTFEQDNMTITVVPIRESNELHGYAAVGAL